VSGVKEGWRALKKKNESRSALFSLGREDLKHKRVRGGNQRRRANSWGERPIKIKKLLVSKARKKSHRPLPIQVGSPRALGRGRKEFQTLMEVSFPEVALKRIRTARTLEGGERGV